MDLSTKLTAGQLSWLLDPEIAGVPPTIQKSSLPLPDRLEKLNENNQETLRLVAQIDAHVDFPTQLLADYEEAPLLSQVHTPPDMQPYMKTFIETLVREINVKTSLKFQLPTPLFRNRHFYLETTIPQHRVDLSTIAFDGTKRLTLAGDVEAFSTLQKCGVYKRGDYDITFSWYPGRDKIKTWRYKRWAEAAYQWTVLLPSVIVGPEQSIGLGMWQLVSGIGISLNRLFGVIPTTFPKHTPDEIDRECAKKFFQWLIDEKGFTVTATEVIDNGSLHRLGSSRVPHIERYPVIFEHPEHGKLDVRIMVPKIRSAIADILEEVRVETYLNKGPKRMPMIASLSRDMPVEAASQRYAEVWHDCHLEVIEARRSEIDGLSSFPDLVSTLVQDRRAQFVVGRHTAARRNVLDDAIKREMQLWKKTHPVISKSSKYESRKLAALREIQETKGGLYSGLLHELEEMNLSEAALIVSLQDEFSESETLSMLKQDLQKARKPEKVEISMMKLPKNWTVRRVTQTNGFEVYELEFMRKVSILSSSPLWRLQAFAVRYFTSIWNSSFFLINKATVALRRWNLFRDSFDCRKPAVNLNTGQFLTTPIRTLRGRLSALCDWRKDVLRRARLGEHIIRIREGLYLDTCWAHFWTSMGVGLGSLSVIVYTTAETFVFVVGTGVALVTSPVWSLIFNLGYALHNALIYDSDLPHEGEKRKSPLMRNLLGIPTFLFSTLRGFFHSLKGAALSIGGEFRFLWDRTWHAIMTLMLRRAEVPTNAEGFFWSTSGRGMKTPYVLIDSDTAILALMAHLSRQELSAARSEMNAELNEPRRFCTNGSGATVLEP